MSDARSRVTVVGARKKVDIAIPADAPIAEYSDLLARMLDQPEDEALPPVWSLAQVGAAAFPITSSLAREGVSDGAVLYLRDVLVDEDKEPVVHSVAEVIVAEKSQRASWNRRTAGHVAVLLGVTWLVAALWYVGLTGGHPSVVGVSAGILGTGLAVFARALRKHSRTLPTNLGTQLGCAVIPCAALAAVLAPGPAAVDTSHLLYLAIGLLVGFVIALIAAPDVVLGAITLLIGIGGVLTAALVPLHVSTADTAATVVVTGVLFLAIAPRTAGLLVAASWLSMSSPDVDPDGDSERLAERVVQAHRALVVLVTLTCVPVGIALIVVAQPVNPFTLAVAIVATLVLFLRSSTFELASEAIGPVIAAAAGVFGLLTMLSGSDVSRPFVLPAMFSVAAVAVGVGLPVLFWGGGRAANGERSGPVGPVLTVAQIVLPALLLGVYGLYATLWGLGS